MKTVVLDAESFAYPRHLLDECTSGLLLFCSGRMGAADGHWFRDAGLVDVTCVDWDEKTLEPFRAEYPEEWRYVQADVFEWANLVDHRFDIVSADAPSQYVARMISELPLWCRLANRYVTATVMGDLLDKPVSLPDDWDLLETIERASYPDGRVYHWLVLERSRA